MAKFIPNWNCHYWVSQQTELTQSKTPPPTAINSHKLDEVDKVCGEVEGWVGGASLSH